MPRHVATNKNRRHHRVNNVTNKNNSGCNKPPYPIVILPNLTIPYGGKNYA